MSNNVPEWFARLMVAAAEACAGTRLREGTIRAYWALLGTEFTEPQIVRAIEDAIKEGNDFVPSVAAIRRRIVPLTDDAGMMAWNGLHQAASSVGGYGSLTCDDPAVAWAVKLVFGGWPGFCEQALDIATSAWVAKRNEFIVAYREGRRQRLISSEAVRLTGLCEQEDRYERKQSVWGGRLSVTGTVTVERERPQLAGGDDVAQLPEAKFE